MSHMGYRCLMAVDREQVLRSAAALLTRKSTATMDEVAKAAGISRATLHRQFAGRDALVRALEELGIRECEAALDAARLDEGTRRGRRTPAGRARSSRAAGLLAFLYTENQLFEGDAAATRAGPGSTPASPRCSGAARSSGEFRIDLTPAWLTEALYGLIGLGRLGRAGRPGGRQGLPLHDRRAAARRRTDGEWNHDQHPAAGIRGGGGEAPGPLARALRPRPGRAAGGRRRDRPRPRHPVHQRGPEAVRHPAPVDRRRLLLRHRGPARLHGQPRRPHRPQEAAADRRHGVRRRLRAQRLRDHARDDDRGPGAARCRGRDPDARPPSP